MNYRLMCLSIGAILLGGGCAWIGSVAKQAQREDEALQEFGPNQIRSIGFSHPIHPSLELKSGWNRLTTIRAIGVWNVTNEQMPLVCTFAGLEELHVSGDLLTDDGFLQIQKLHKLQQLLLTVPNVSRTAIDEIKRLHPQLEVWEISGDGERRKKV